MKHIFIFFFLFYSFASTAQNHPIKYGVKGGLTFAWNDFHSTIETYKEELPRVGQSLGVYANYYVVKHFGFTAELDFLLLNEGGISDDLIAQISIGEDTLQNLNFELKTTSQYLQVPLGIIVRTGDFNTKVRFYAQSAIGIGFLLSSKKHLQFFNQDGILVFPDSSSDANYTALRFSLILEMGLEFRLDDRHYLKTGYRIDYNPNNVNRDEPFEIQNHFAELSVAITF